MCRDTGTLSFLFVWTLFKPSPSIQNTLIHNGLITLFMHFRKEEKNLNCFLEMELILDPNLN